MVAALVVVASLAYWEPSRESEVALREFADEQATLASASGTAIEAKLRSIQRDALAIAPESARLQDLLRQAETAAREARP